MNALIRKCAARISLIIVISTFSACKETGLTGTDSVTVDRPFAYIVRDFPVMGDVSSIDSRPPLDPRAPYQFNPGARLYVRDRVALDSEETDILKDRFGNGDYDVKDLTVSPDGERIAFAAHGPAGDLHDYSWNIYEYNFSTRKVRRFLEDDELANAGQDTNPAYTNDGRIVFSSDRQVATGNYRLVDRRVYIADFNEPASLLHIMQPDGSKMTQITFGAHHDIEPNTTDEGQIVFIRWGREYETLSDSDCTADNIDNPNFSTQPHGGGYGHGNGNGFPPGLEKPKQWTTDDKCGASMPRPDGTRVFIQDVLSLYRIAPSGGNLHRYFGSINEVASDASFIHYMDPIPMPDGNLVTIMRHIYNPVYGGDVVKLNSKNFYAVGKPIDASVSGEAEESMTPGLVDFYPNQVSPSGWYSAVFPYRDGSGRLLASWAQCLVQSGDVDAVCQGSSISSDLLAPQYGIWSVDPAKKTRLPVVKGHNQALYTDIVIGYYDRNARPYQSPKAGFLLDKGFGVFHIRSVYDMDGKDMAAPDGGITTLRDPSITRPDERSERFIRVVAKRSIPSELEEAILDSPILNPTDGGGQEGLRPVLGSGGRDLYDILSYGSVEPDGSAMIPVPHDTYFTFEVVNKYDKRVDLIAEPGYHYNYLKQHSTPLLLEEGELRECNGCHDPNSDYPHARSDIQSASANPGAPGDGMPFPNANPEILAVQYRDTMDQALSFWLGTIPGGAGDVAYQDYWTDAYLGDQPAPSFVYSYRDLTTPAPVNDTACLDTWTSNCKITINYREHIQPIWDVCRPQAGNQSCTSCHDKADNTPQNKCPGGGGSGGNLVLSGEPPDTDPWNQLEVASYVQLFEPHYYLLEDSGQWSLVTSPDECPNGVVGDLTVEPQAGTCIAERLMSARGAIASARFFRLFDDDHDDDAYEIDLTGSKKDVSDHKGWLTPAELRLIAEWLDAGAHYYNDTDKFVLPTP